MRVALPFLGFTSTTMDPVAPLSFPPPPPAPSAPQRAASTASWKSVEPSVDDLQREVRRVSSCPAPLSPWLTLLVLPYRLRK